ncbi:DUF4123 domain-containing protein [Variovorax dokdonensis]|uniref:DUF4123 domain-containing protein n=1 Tax=Variovorax dokdonensis TaxID=344883 RepID=A0ABT7NC97_9BURK|nr:DUF4123 domain-containing protein [Variovorax dokdonensis]MDM0045553.1 DUF4123 domain-containing protein [Variovorax dokdonensis]
MIDPTSNGDADHVKSYCLMDGSMAYNVVSTSKVLSDPQTPWVETLLTNDALRMAGPILMDITGVGKHSERGQEVFHAWRAYPRQLHVSLITTKLSLQALTDHLRPFTSFRRRNGNTYGLRISDCRVLAYLPAALSSEQWSTLTAPMIEWKISSRAGGDRLPLSLEDARFEHFGAPAPLHLSEEQIEKLSASNEPDALLAEIGKAPSFENESLTQSNYETALECVRAWKVVKGLHRDKLVVLGKKVFGYPPSHRKDQAWLHGKLQELIRA